MCVGVWVWVVVCMCHTWLSAQHNAVAVTGPQEDKATEGRVNLRMRSLTIGAGQQRIIQLLEGQETCNWEKINTHNVCRECHIGRSIVGWMVKKRQYEDLDLRATNFSVQISKVHVFFFATSLQVPLHIVQRATNFCVLKLFAKFVSFVRSHFHLTSVTRHDAAAAVRVYCSDGVQYVQATVIQYPTTLVSASLDHHQSKYL